MAKTTTSTQSVEISTVAAGRLINNTEAAVAIAPIGYQAARAKHDLNARVAAAQKYAALL